MRIDEVSLFLELDITEEYNEYRADTGSFE